MLVVDSQKERGGSRFRSLTAPALGLGGLSLFLFIILLNLPTLVSKTSYGPVSIGILVLLGAVFEAGPLVARRRPHVDLD